MSTAAPTKTEIAAAEKVVAAVTQVGTLAERFRDEGQDETFLAQLEDLVHIWGKTA